MPELMPEAPKDVLMEVCAFCSPPHALYPHEIAAEIIDATFIDYQARRPPGRIGFVLCVEHRALLIENMKADCEAAATRRAALEEDPGLPPSKQDAFLNQEQSISKNEPHGRKDEPTHHRFPLPYPRAYLTSCRICGEPIEITVTAKINPNGEIVRSWHSDHQCEYHLFEEDP